MFEILVLVGFIGLLVVLLLLYRVYSLVSVAKGTDDIRTSKSNTLNGILFLLFFVVGTVAMFWYGIEEYDRYTQPQASAHADDYDSLFWITMWVALAAFLVTNLLLFFFAFRYKYSDNRKALFYPDNTKLEIAWTIFPAVVLVLLIFNGFKVWNELTDAAPEDALVMEVMGYQFAWEARYGGKDGELGAFDFRKVEPVNQMGLDLDDPKSYDDFMPLEIYLPKGRPVEVKIRARDVLHSVFFPHFRQKMDAMPGMPTRMWFTPTKTTAEMREETGNPEFDYELACTEICGKGHFSMRKKVVVVEADEFDKWYAEQESWLTNNPDLLKKVPAAQRAAAAKAAGLELPASETAKEPLQAQVN